MDHETCRERLLELCYGELAAKESLRVEGHLLACPACRAERDRLAATLRAMREHAVPAAPVGGEGVLLAAARKAGEERKRSSLGLALGGFGLRLLCGSAFAVLMVFLLLHRGERRSQVAERGRGAAPPSLSAPPPAEAAPVPPAPARAEDLARLPARAEALARNGAPARAPEAAAREEVALAAPGAAASAGPQPRAKAAARAEAASGPEEPGALGAVAREVERRLAAGELSAAQRRFEPCPGGDLRRTAFVDREQRVRKLVHERDDGAEVLEWFDGEGRLREAVLRGRGAAWSEHLEVDERGAERVVEASGPPPAAAPTLVRRDPSGAFFAGPGCRGAERP